MAAEIRVTVAEKEKETSKLKREGERLKLIKMAAGQREQVEVPGQDRVMPLALLEKIPERPFRTRISSRCPGSSWPERAFRKASCLPS